MTPLATLCAMLGLSVAVIGAARTRPPDDLKAGDPAPNFSLPGSDGKTYSLADYKGKQVVVLAWFPKAFTGG